MSRAVKKGGSSRRGVMAQSQKRVPLYCLVRPVTIRLINQIADEAGSQGRAVDKAVAALAVAESFGKDALNVGGDDSDDNQHLGATIIRAGLRKSE